MLISSHTIAAGVVGEYTGNPFLAFLLGIIIHFLLDSIPHYDTTDEGKITKRQLILVFGDLVFCLLVIFLFIKPKIEIGSPFFWGAFGGILPDILDQTPVLKEFFRKSKIGGHIHKFHENIQKYWKQPNPFWGILIQIILVIFFTAIAK